MPKCAYSRWPRSNSSPCKKIVKKCCKKGCDKPISKIVDSLSGLGNGQIDLGKIASVIDQLLVCLNDDEKKALGPIILDVLNGDVFTDSFANTVTIPLITAVADAKLAEATAKRDALVAALPFIRDGTVVTAQFKADLLAFLATI